MASFFLFLVKKPWLFGSRNSAEVLLEPLHWTFRLPVIKSQELFLKSIFSFIPNGLISVVQRYSTLLSPTLPTPLIHTPTHISTLTKSKLILYQFKLFFEGFLILTKRNQHHKGTHLTINNPHLTRTGAKAQRRIKSNKKPRIIFIYKN